MSNTVAVEMYKKLGYIVYRTVLQYYSGDPDEDAYGNIFYIMYVVYSTFFYFCLFNISY